MFLKKIYKLQHFLESKFRENTTRETIQNIRNPTLTKVFETIISVKNNEFSAEDLEIFHGLQNYRIELKQSNQSIDYALFSSPARKVSEIYQIAASPEIWSRFHYLLAKNLSAKNYLEIGTNLGISGSYILSAMKANPNSKFVTMEGIEDLCELAEKQFKTLVDPNQFQIIKGLYDDTFPQIIQNDTSWDIAFIDGNHQYEPTLHYFEELKKKSKEATVFVFDDIYWNEEMKNAWKKIKQDTSINFAVDLFKMGIVILDKKETKRDTNFKMYLTNL